jgi:hypothetical protein
MLNARDVIFGFIYAIIGGILMPADVPFWRWLLLIIVVATGEAICSNWDTIVAAWKAAWEERND